MPDALLPYFNSELAAIRKLAGEFAVANPEGRQPAAHDGRRR